MTEASYSSSSALKIAEILLKEKAVFLNPQDPFTWASGIKSPVYCDNRMLISTIESRRFIIDALKARINPTQVDLIAGTATAGIPWAAWPALELNLPLVYVRSGQKDHGRKSAIEGQVRPGQKVVLIEDLISTGKSSLAAAEKLKEAQLQVTKVLSLFTYGFEKAHQTFKHANIQYESLCDFETLAHFAHQSHQLDEVSLREVLAWKKNVQFP